MPNTKTFYTDIATTGIITLGCRVQRVADSFYLDDLDGVFKVGPADQDLLVTEGPAFRYVTTENRTVWNDGLYRVQFFDSATAKPIASDQIEIQGDTIVTLSSRATPANVTAGTATVTAAITASEAAIRGADSDDLKDLSDQIDGVDVKTTNLPADPASQVTVDASITTSQGVVTGAIAASESAIRGADADDLKDISDELASALAAILAAIGGIAGGAHVLWSMEEKLIRPDSGSTAYPIIIDIKDSEGNPEAPDSAPTIKIVNYAGTVRVTETPMTQVGADVGVYRYNYTITSTTILEKQIVRVKVIEGGVTNYYDEVTEVYEEGGYGSGAGSYPVDHNYGSTDALRICEYGVVPDTGIGGVWIYAYLKADFDSGLRGNPYRKGLSHTEDDGRWANAMMLVSGETYRIVCQGGTYFEETAITEITIP